MKKIMFNDAYGLTDATIEGRKTNTRRAEFSAEEQQVLNEADDVYMDGDDVVAHFDSAEDIRFGTRYKVGEVVAAAQRYADIPGLDDLYRIPETERYFEDANIADEPGYRNKMFVKAELMPHRIRITGIHPERLQDISDEDCIKEGIYKDECTTYFNGYGFELEHLEKGLVLAKRWYDTPREAFAALIDKVSGRGTWQRNPWVVAYEFELIK
ncbi:hypothetical protein [Alistipes sp.]|uniref:hypothetical protein n=1 Tax=Alistipes sp. TaxID=1872444 RepID=UPI0035286276